jgi:hypothetical protein
MSRTVLTFRYEKETKNSLRFKEDLGEGKAPNVGTLYVQKWFADNSNFLEVTINKKG